MKTEAELAAYPTANLIFWDISLGGGTVKAFKAWLSSEFLLYICLRQQFQLTINNCSVMLWIFKLMIFHRAQSTQLKI
jgi:hypothetical protein